MPQEPSDSQRRIVFLTQTDAAKLRAHMGQSANTQGEPGRRYRPTLAESLILAKPTTALQDSGSKYIGKYYGKTIALAPSVNIADMLALAQIGTQASSEDCLIYNWAEMGDGLKDAPGVDVAAADAIMLCFDLGVVDADGHSLLAGWCLNSWVCPSPPT